jgi:Tol biopolymer transport system component
VIAPAAISPDGTQICFSYRRQGRAGLYLMSADGTNIRTLTESFDVRGAASWSPDGKWIAIAANQGEGTRVFKVPVNGGAPVRLVETLSFYPLWSPDGRFILYSEPSQGARFRVRAITADKAAVPLPEIWIDQLSPNPYRFLPNRRELVFLKDQSFFWINLDTGQQRQLTGWKTGFRVHSFDLSVDGTQIIFDRVRDNSDIVLIELKG